jgi:1-acyl-sn-glycerol-3-phosphate acyltransferase
MVSIFLRSLVYNVLFYALLVFWILVAIPTYLMPPRAFMAIAKAWARSSVWLMRVVCNTKVDYRGLEKIPEGPLIVASKHQSMWETFALMQFFDARTPVGAPPNYMTGVGQIYANSGVPCIPVALNSGLFWPRRTFMRYPGTLVVEFLDPLPPGLSRKEFIARIRTLIEDATDRLVEKGREEQAQLFGRVPSAPAKA